MNRLHFSLHRNLLLYSISTNSWEQRKLSEVLSSYTDPVEIPRTGYERLGIRSHAKGTFHNFVPAGHELQTAQMHRVAADKFIVNITFGWEHAVAVTDENDAGKLVSHRFPQFSLSEELDPKFLKFIILDEDFRHHLWLASPGGAGRNRVLNINEMLQYEIMIPNVPEQRKIARMLIDLDNLITLHQRKLDRLKNIKKSMLDKMFPKDGEVVPEIRFKGFTDAWEQRKLEEIVDSYSGGTPTAGKSEYYGGTIPFIRSAEVNSDTTELFLTEEGLKTSSAKMVNKGDILYALYGATSGEVGLARLDGAINQAILDIKPHEDYDTPFIMNWLRKSKESIIGTYLQGGQGNLSGTIVTSLMVDCPDYDEQKRIGEFFTNIDNLITLHQRKSF